MEHATLHALLLTGMIVALGGPVAALWLFIPSARLLGKDAADRAMLEPLLASAGRWTMWGALAAAFATFIDFFVVIAELKGQTVFAGADVPEVWRFAWTTHVGRFCLAQLALLLLTVLAARLLRGGNRWRVTGALAFAAIVAAGNVSHAAAQPGASWMPVIEQIAHIGAAALWMGVLLHIFLARRLLLGDPAGGRVAFVANVVRRFSPLALAMTSLLGVTGAVAAWRYMRNVDIVIHSPYGLTLLVKLAVLAPAIYAGFINFRRIGPALARLAAEGGASPGARDVFYRFSRMLELEVTAGVLVITVAGILGSVSPPGEEDGAYRLTAAQVRAFLRPHLPNTNIQGWELPDDPLGVSDREKRYAEFTHNWSGIMVCLMGLSWLAQSAGGRAGAWASRLFPFLLLLFGLFIALAANPEVWILHRYTFRQAIADPILLEHQLGGVIVFILAWLAWRDRKTPIESQPLDYSLSIIMIVGSLLLLGHAHTLSTVPDDLTNLINTQHAVFGALGLFAGTTRLLMLRDLVPAQAARFAWPSFVICLGVFMTFFYREIV